MHFSVLLAFLFIRGGSAQTATEESQMLFLDQEPQSLPETPCVAFNGDQGICKLLAQCASFATEVNEISESPACTITEGQQGICCPPNKPQTADPGAEVEIILDPTPSIEIPITTTEINDASERAIQQQAEIERFQEELVANNIVAEVDSPAFLHARLFETTDEILESSKNASIVLEATKNIKNDLGLTKEEAEVALSQIDAHDTPLKDTCPTDPICEEVTHSFRTIDGTCNNIRHADWGKTGISFIRMLPADYQDGVETIRLSAVSKKPLPSARAISAEISPSANKPYNNFTNLIWQWGQFVDHDTTHTPIAKSANKSDIRCCSDEGVILPDNQLDPNCFPIEIPATDRFYSGLPTPQNCMDFVRSTKGSRPFCKFGPREQINQITSYIDASNVYGSERHEMEALRTFKDGKLRVNNENNQNLLPPNPTGSGCTAERVQHPCFLAGDTRVNEQADLAVMHTVWHRQHNKIVEALALTNPGWTDELLFQEGRRIVGAQQQHIIYNEYLPIVLGREYVEAYGLLPMKEGYFPGYRNDIDATIYNVFATAAFRYGHTLITDRLLGFNKRGVIDTELQLSKTQFVPFDLYNPLVLDNLIRGLSIQQAQEFDRFFSEELTNLLFRGKRNFGMDLVALNIQRGRDHGLPPYTKWREVCNLAPISDWSTLGNVMKPEIVEGFKKFYESVDDIDLFIGAIAEDIVPNTLVGPTLQCLLGRQFIRLKIGDRFYYENGDDLDPWLSQFSEGQLQELRKTSLARIFCDNGDNISEMQPLAFLTPHRANQKVPCSDPAIPRMSLRPWANRPVWVK